MLSLVLDDHQVCRGLVAMDLQTLELKAFPADAVIMATGGPGLIFGKSTNSMVCTGSAVSACYQQGAKYANGEFIQVHPTSIPGEDKLRLMSESARGEGGRVWVPRQPGDTQIARVDSREGALVLPRREISGLRQSRSARHRDARDLPGLPRRPRRRRREPGLSRPDAHPGGDARPQARRDPRNLRDVRRRRSALRADADLSRRALFDGRAVGRFRTADEIPGLFAAGECDYSIHGANRLGANSLVSCVYGGFVAAPAAIEYAKNVERNGADGSRDLRRRVETSAGDQRSLDQAERQREPVQAARGDGQVDDRQRDGRPLQRSAEGDRREVARADGSLQAHLDQRFESVGDEGGAARAAFGNMLELARVITLGALESQRIARSALQAGFSRSRRREFHEDNHRRVFGRRPGVFLRAGRRLADRAAQARLQQGQEGTRTQATGLNRVVKLDG